MTEQVQKQEPVMINLSLNLQQINMILQGLGQLPTSSGAWPLSQFIVQTAQNQLPEQKESTEETVTE